jgi:hypothetical protein
MVLVMSEPNDYVGCPTKGAYYVPLKAKQTKRLPPIPKKPPQRSLQIKADSQIRSSLMVFPPPLGTNKNHYTIHLKVIDLKPIYGTNSAHKACAIGSGDGAQQPYARL